MSKSLIRSSNLERDAACATPGHQLSAASQR